MNLVLELRNRKERFHTKYGRYSNVQSLVVAGILGLTACTATAPHTELAPPPTDPYEPTNVPVDSVPQSGQQNLTQSFKIPEWGGPPASGAATGPRECGTVPWAPFDYKRLQNCADSLIEVGEFLDAAQILRLQVDARNGLDAIALRTLMLSRILAAYGDIPGAQKVLEGFLVYKPVLAEWMDSAEALDAELQTSLAGQVETMQPLVRQIRNLASAGAEYSVLRPLTDSLRAVAPGDSLVRWAKAQDEAALQRSHQKAEFRSKQIRQLVLEQNQFDQALGEANDVVSRYAGLFPQDRFDTLPAWVEGQKKQFGSGAHAQWWKGRDPNQVMGQATELVESAQWLKAKELLVPLLSTQHRGKAQGMLQHSAERYCEEQRQVAATRYGSSLQFKSKPARAIQEIQAAVESLQQCLQHFPEPPQKAKIISNLNMLQKERAKLEPTP